jgi:molybdopterin molybdotransferase
MTLAPLPAVQEEVLAAITRLEAVRVPLAEAQGLALAEEVRSGEAVPPFANTAMDGYAVRAADTTGAAAGSPVRLRVVGHLPAGHAPDRAVAAGEAIRIMTGAPIPPGADAVVMVERTAPEGDEAVRIEAAAAPGDHVRAAGGDLVAGAVVFPAGTVLGAAALGVLASIGAAEVRVTRRARVGVLSTGDELVPADDPRPLEPGQIRDSNRPMLLALTREAGCEAVDLGIARDDEVAITAAIESATAAYDVVLTSGGVSVGDYDYVHTALGALGTLLTWQVAIKPAKPLAFGVVGGTPVFGLPGNPVSSLVSFECFARPALLTRLGHPQRFRPEVQARAEHPFTRRRDGRLHLDRVWLHPTPEGYAVARTGEQASNVLSATAAANGLAKIPDGDGVPAGASVTVMRLDGVPDH